MNSRTYALLTAFIAVICGYFIINSFILHPDSRTVRNDVIQGFLIGFGLAFVTAQVYARIKTTKVNGWTTMFGCGKPGNSFLFRAACAQVFPGPINVPQEAMYWTTDTDGLGHLLSGGIPTSCTSRPGNSRRTMHSGRSLWGMREIILCQTRYAGTASATAPALFRMPTVLSTFTSGMPHLRATNPTGFRHLPANSSCWLRAYLPGPVDPGRFLRGAARR